MSVSVPVDDLEPVVEWYGRVLGMDVVHRYGFDAESFKDLVGTDSVAWNVRGTNIGRSTREFYFGVIDYGTGDTERRSLRGPGPGLPTGGSQAPYARWTTWTGSCRPPLPTR